MSLPTNLLEKYRVEIDRAYKDYLNNYPARIEALRRAKDINNKNFNIPINQKDVAALLGVAAQNYHKMEKGKTGGGNNMTMQVAIGLSVLYRCQLDYIVFGESKEGVDNKVLEEQVKILKDSLDAQKHLNQLLKSENERLKELIGERG